MSFDKLSGYKISTQKSVSPLSTENKQIEIKILKALPIIISSKKIKHVDTNPTKHE